MAEFDPDAYLAKEDKKKGFDPDAYLAKTQPTTTARKEQGKALVSLADSALNSVTGLLDMAAHLPARAYYGLKGGMTQEEAAAKAQQESTSPKDIIGTYLGYKGQPSYENSPVKQVGEYVGQQLGENVIQPVAQATGIPEPDVSAATNIGMLAAGVPAGKVIKSTANAAGNVAKGALGSATGYIARPSAQPKGYQIPSARTKLGNDFIEPESYAAWQRGEIPIEEMGNYPHTKPIQELPQNALERAALQLGGGTMPYKGQAAQAFGERLGETYRNPVTAAIDLGSAAFTGIPFYTAGKTALGGVRAAGDYLMSRKGFDPTLPENLRFAKDAQQTIENMGGVAGPIPPATAQTPAAQAAMATTERIANQPLLGYTPPKQPTMYVAPEGQAGTNLKQVEQQSLKERYAPQPVEGYVPPQPPAPPKPVLDSRIYNADGTKKSSAEILQSLRKNGGGEPEGGVPITTPQGPKPTEGGGGGSLFETSLPTEVPTTPLHKLPYASAEEMTNALTAAKYSPYDIKSLVAKRFAPEVPVVETNPYKQYFGSEEKAPPTAEVAAEREAARKNFVETMVPERMKEMKERRADNKELYAEQAKTMREIAKDRKDKGARGWGKFAQGQISAKDNFTTRTAVGDIVRETVGSFVTSKNNSIVVKQQGFNDLAKLAGITIDLDSLPNLSGKSLKEGRKIMRKWTYDQLHKEIPELGLYDRSPSMKSLSKQAEKEFAAEQAAMTPEERAADKLAQEEVMAKANERMNKLLGKTPKAGTPKVEAPKTEATKMIDEGKLKGPAGTDVNKILEMIRARQNKGKPPGAMEMMTGPNPLSKEDIFLANVKQNYNHLPEGSFIEDGIRHEIVKNSAYDNMPKEIRDRLVEPGVIPKIYRQIDVKTGKVLKGPKSYTELQAEAADLLKKAKEGKKKND